MRRMPISAPKTAPIMIPVLEDPEAPPANVGVGLGSNDPDTVITETVAVLVLEAVVSPEVVGRGGRKLAGVGLSVD